MVVETKPDQSNFGKIRNIIWPIHNHELKKLVPMFLLIFLISFVYSLLRALKVSLIVKAEHSGVDVLPYLKLGAVLPGALLLTYVFTRLVSRFNRDQVFYTILSGFLLYFFLFAFILLPNHHHLQLDTLSDFLSYSLGFPKGLVACVRHLNLTLFFVLSEMWSTVVLSMLFWGFANEVTRVDEAKRFYAIFALGSNCSGVAVGFFSELVRKIPYLDILPYKAAQHWIFYQLMAVLIVGVTIIGLFYWLNKKIFYLENVQALQIPKKNNSLTISECFVYLSKSCYLRYIVIMVLGYNIVYNLADVVWTHKVDEVYKTSQEFNTYMNHVIKTTGIVAVVFAFVVSGNVIRKFGWKTAALIPLSIWALTSAGFFAGLMAEGTRLFDVVLAFTSNPANFVLFLGSIQICLGRACKYTVFDETKEIAFIPLSKQEQRRAKAVVDGLATRFGKSAGSLIWISLLQFGDISTAIPYAWGIIAVGLIGWSYSVIKLGNIIDNKENDKVKLEYDASVSQPKISVNV